MLVEPAVRQRHLPQHLDHALFLGDRQLLVQAARELLELDGSIGRAVRASSSNNAAAASSSAKNCFNDSSIVVSSAKSSA